MGIASSLEAGIESTTNTYVSGASTALTSALAPIALTGITISIIWLGWSIARGRFAGPNGVATSNTFGSVTAVNSPPRRLEMGAKINF